MTNDILKRMTFPAVVAVVFVSCKPLLESSKYKLSEGNELPHQAIKEGLT